MKKDEESGHYIHEVTGRPYLCVSCRGRRLQRLIYRIDKWSQPYLCKLGFHDVWDVMELDGSVTTGYCSECDALTKPYRPMPPDEARVAEHEEINRLAEELD